jgi:hypothetical protein
MGLLVIGWPICAAGVPASQIATNRSMTNGIRGRMKILRARGRRPIIIDHH